MPLQIRVGQLAWRAGGAFLILVGAIWILQGFALFPGTFMYDDPVWSMVGAGVALAGAAVILMTFVTR